VFGFGIEVKNILGPNGQPQVREERKKDNRLLKQFVTLQEKQQNLSGKN